VPSDRAAGSPHLAPAVPRLAVPGFILNMAHLKEGI
jgi:hypothetical protein